LNIANLGPSLTNFTKKNSAVTSQKLASVGSLRSEMLLPVWHENTYFPTGAEANDYAVLG
jgi:hypothetical protein